MTYDSWQSFKIKIFNFKKFQNSKKFIRPLLTPVFSTIYTLRSTNNKKRTMSFRHMTREMPKMVKKEKLSSNQTWCKHTILVFFSANIILSGPRKSTFSSPEAIKKIEVNNTHSCRRDIPSILNVPKRPNIKVSFYTSLCLSSHVIPF